MWVSMFYGLIGVVLQEIDDWKWIIFLWFFEERLQMFVIIGYFIEVDSSFWSQWEWMGIYRACLSQFMIVFDGSQDNFFFSVEFIQLGYNIGWVFYCFFIDFKDQVVFCYFNCFGGRFWYYFCYFYFFWSIYVCFKCFCCIKGCRIDI